MIETESIEKERESARFRRFPTVKGSSSFQVIVFEPDSNLIKVAPFLCGCDKRLTSQYGSCENFVECSPQTGELNHILMRHQLQELRQSVDVEDDDNEISTLVANDQIVAIAAEKSSIDTGLFML